MSSIFRLTRVVLLALGVLALIAVTGLLVSFALPVEAWRTGELPSPQLPTSPGQPFAAKPLRIWIDTDAACGHGSRTDPDDCLAILALAELDQIEIVGISTVFGNAPLDVIHRTTQALVAELRVSGQAAGSVYRGFPEPVRSGLQAVGTPAQEGLRSALEEGPLAILALGPVTNIATLLSDHPELRPNVIRIVSVMGRRWGHLFHPVEGGTAPSLFGHGPVFRDFNFALDEEAAAALLGMNLPITFVPYEAARDIMIDRTVLGGMIARGGAAAWVARRSHEWLTYWREDIGRKGFYPFDLIAAAYVAQPPLLSCAEVTVAIGKDAGLFGWLGFRGLFVTLPDQVWSNTAAATHAEYCPEAGQPLGDWLTQRLTKSPAQ